MKLFKAPRFKKIVKIKLTLEQNFETNVIRDQDPYIEAQKLVYSGINATKLFRQKMRNIVHGSNYHLDSNK